MKKFTILCALLTCNLVSQAQFKLSGKIVNYAGKEQLKINIPEVQGFYKENSINIPVAADGTFSIILPIKKQKFANVIFKKEFSSLLLTPNKSLIIDLNENDKILKVVAGTSAPENMVMTAINLEEYPSFMSKAEAIGSMNLATLYTQVVNPYFAERDKKIDFINDAPISANDKKFIASEVRYMALNYLNDLNWMRLKNKKTIDSLSTDLFKKHQVLPERAFTGPKYYSFQNYYLAYLQNTAVAKMKREKIQSNVPLPYYGISLDSANVIAEKYGNAYLRFLLATKNLPDAVTEQITYQDITSLYYDKDLEHTEIMAKAFKSKFPASAYNGDINKKINALKQLLIINETNKTL